MLQGLNNQVKLLTTLIIEICENSNSMAKASADLGIHFNTFKRIAVKLKCYNPNQAGVGINKNYFTCNITQTCPVIHQNHGYIYKHHSKLKNNNLPRPKIEIEFPNKEQSLKNELAKRRAGVKDLY